MHYCSFIFWSVDLILSWACPSPMRHGIVQIGSYVPNRQSQPCLSNSVCTMQSLKGPSFDDVGDNDIRLYREGQRKAVISSKSEAFSGRDGISLHPALGQGFHCQRAGKRRERMKMNVLPWQLLKAQSHLKSRSPRPPREGPSGAAPGPKALMGTFIRSLCK